MTRVVDLLQYLLEERGSDLLVKVGSAPVIRRNGRLEHTDLPALDPAAIEALADELLTERRSAEFHATGEADLAHSVPGLGRFRINVYRQRGSVSLAIRRVVPGAPAIADLGVPPVVADLASQRDGLVVVTGPAASGKTTTAAAMVDHVNASQARHIVTIEDPIEVLHADRMAVVSQREVGTDTPDIAEALRRVSRQGADVIFISDMSEADVISEALSTAASGRLVIAIMNTLSVYDTLDLIVDKAPPHQQEHIRQLLARTLRGVICQRLLDRADGRGRIAVIESLTATPKMREAIAHGGDRKVIQKLVREGDYHGMMTFDQALFHLFTEEMISLESALERASNPEDFRIAAQQAGLVAAAV